MDDRNIEKMTRFLLESARAVNRKSAYLDKIIDTLKDDIEELELIADQIFDDLSNFYRDEVFRLHGVIQDSASPEEQGKPTDKANDVMSIWFYDQDETSIEQTLINLKEQIRLMKQEDPG